MTQKDDKIETSYDYVNYYIDKLVQTKVVYLKHLDAIQNKVTEDILLTLRSIEFDKDNVSLQLLDISDPNSSKLQTHTEEAQKLLTIFEKTRRKKQCSISKIISDI